MSRTTGGAMSTLFIQKISNVTSLKKDQVIGLKNILFWSLNWTELSDHNHNFDILDYVIRAFKKIFSQIVKKNYDYCGEWTGTIVFSCNFFKVFACLVSWSIMASSSPSISSSTYFTALNRAFLCQLLLSILRNK